MGVGTSLCRQKVGVNMTNEERLRKYIQEHCKNCKNKDKELCNIRIFNLNKIIETKCEFYERRKKEGNNIEKANLIS